MSDPNLPDRYADLYRTFDKGHDLNHIKSVRDRASVLSSKYAPDKSDLIDLAAALHDVGISRGRDNHPEHGYSMLKEDKDIRNRISNRDFNLLLEAVREHGASSGRPESTVARIVSDADKTAEKDPYDSILRAYNYGKSHFPSMTDDQQVRRAVDHIVDKYSQGGYGSNVFFPESRDILEKRTEAARALQKMQDIREIKSKLGINSKSAHFLGHALGTLSFLGL